MIYEPYPFKRCNRCKSHLLFSEFQKSSHSSDGLQHTCKACRKAYYNANAEKIREKSKKWADKNRERKQAQDRAYRATHREQYKERSRDYYREHREDQLAKAHESYIRQCDEKREYGKRYYQLHKDEQREQRRAWADANKHTAKFKEQQRERTRRYYQRRKHDPEFRKKNCANAAIATLRRRARKRNLDNRFSREDWRRALAYFNNRCAVCARPVGLWHTLAADHWIPLTAANCPGTVPENIVPLCHSKKDGTDSCNPSKFNRDPVEWLTSRYSPRKAKQILKRIEAYFQWVREQDSHHG